MKRCEQQIIDQIYIKKEMEEKLNLSKPYNLKFLLKKIVSIPIHHHRSYIIKFHFTETSQPLF